MKGRLAACVSLAVALLVMSVPLFAHHGRTGYDNKTVLNLKGTVTGFEWTNPHVQLHFDAPDDKGVMKHWTVEAANPFSEKRIGWTKDQFKPGDQVTVSFHPAANGNTVGLYIRATMADGKVVPGGPGTGDTGGTGQ